MEQITNLIPFLIGAIFSAGVFYGTTNGKFKQQKNFNNEILHKMDNLGSKIDDIQKDIKNIIERIAYLEGKINNNE